MIEVQDRTRVEMSQRDRDVLKVMQPVLEGQRTQAEAARLLKLSVRQIRRIQRKLEAEGDASLVHGLRGKPSNHRHDPKLKPRVLKAYRARYADFGPTFAAEKLAGEGRPRRSCFGELVQMDASIHDWLEGRGETVVLITMIDDATSRVMARFYPSATVEAHMDLLERWIRKYGRPLAIYTDRHSIFEPHEKGQPLADPDAETQFGRALRELDVELIRAHSPQAKGRVERSFGTGSLGEGIATGASEDLRRGEQGVGPCGAGPQQTLRQEAESDNGLSPAIGFEVEVGVDPVDPGRAGGGQRLRGAVAERALPVAAAVVAGFAEGDGGDRGTAGRHDGDSVRGSGVAVPRNRPGRGREDKNRWRE